VDRWVKTAAAYLRQWCLRNVTVKGAAQTMQASTFSSVIQCSREPRAPARRRRRLGHDEGMDGRRRLLPLPSVL